MSIPDPYGQIRRLVGRRTQPEMWPNTHDEWDAYDESGEFLMTMPMGAVNQLLGSFSHPREVILVESADGLFEPITVPPTSTFDLHQQIRLPIGALREGAEDFLLINPDRVPSREEWKRTLEGLFKDKP